MTDYIHPIRDLEAALKRSRQAFYILGALLAVSIIAVPWMLRLGPVVVLDPESYSRVVQSQPWRLTVSRLEGFTKLYLSNRWEWTSEDFEKKRSSLAEILDPAALPQIRDSLQSLETLAKGRQARSYYVFEGWGFSNGERKIEARIDRVIRIKNAAIATPLIVRLQFVEAPVTETNPYGLKILGLEETEVQEGSSS